MMKVNKENALDFYNAVKRCVGDKVQITEHTLIEYYFMDGWEYRFIFYDSVLVKVVSFNNIILNEWVVK